MGINDVFENDLVLFNENETEIDKTLSQNDTRLFNIHNLLLRHSGFLPPLYILKAPDHASNHE